MPTKVGVIARIDRVGGQFVRLALSDGTRVELPHALMQYVTEHYQPGAILVFVERRGRIFNFVQWVGTADEAYLAEESGVLERREIEMLYQNGRRLTGG